MIIFSLSLSLCRKFLELILKERNNEEEEEQQQQHHHHHHHNDHQATNRGKEKRKRRFFNKCELLRIKEILESTSSSSYFSSSSSSSSFPHWYYYYVKKNFQLRLDKQSNQNYVVVNDRKIISLEDIFDVIHSAHIACGHGGEKRTYYEIRNHRNIANITNEQIKLFISLCQICKRKKNILKKNNSSSSSRIISSSFGERAQIDLIDLSKNCTKEGYKYILNYQDHLTKFVMLKPLKSKKTLEVNEAVLDIFTTLGAPQILQCDNGMEFSGIQSGILDKYWPNCKMTHSRPRHPQSQGSIERANGDVMNILRGWLNSSSSSSWVEGLKFVQLQKNNSFNRTINCSPFKAVFGREMPVPFDECVNNNNNNNNNNSEKVVEMDDDDDDDEEEENNIPMENGKKDYLASIANNVENVKSIRKNICENLLKNSSSSSSSGNSSNSNSNDGEETNIISIGTPVIIKIPKVDCHKLGLPNIVGVIYKYLPNIQKYNIKTQHGVINCAFSHTDFEICPNLNVELINDINNNNLLLSLREAARLEAMKFVGCQCYGRCQNNKCFCFKHNKHCGSLCKHKCTSDICLNKIFSNKKLLREKRKK